MKAFILAAGLGTRLRPLTDNQPKVMVEVAGKKILERTIEQLAASGVRDLVINTHYYPESVTSYFGSGEKHGVNIEYSHEPELLGTAGAVKKAQKHFVNEKEFLVVYGDNVFDIDLQKFMDTPLADSNIMVMLFDRNKSSNSGMAGDVVEVNEQGYISNFWPGLTRPDVSYVNGGIYKVTPQIFYHIPEQGPYDFARQLFPLLVQSKVPLKTFIIEPHHAVFGGDTLESLEKTRNHFV